MLTIRNSQQKYSCLTDIFQSFLEPVKPNDDDHNVDEAEITNYRYEVKNKLLIGLHRFDVDPVAPLDTVPGGCGTRHC
jgi:hypothetical protein